MPKVSNYKPEVSRKGTEVTTNKRNIENIFAILNRHEQRISDLESSLLVIVGPGGISLDDAEEIALMMMDAE